MPAAVLQRPVTPGFLLPLQSVLDLLPHNLVRFLAIGSAGLSLDSAAFSLIAGQGTSEYAARAISLVLATLLTWQLNRRFTFGRSERRRGAEGGWYAAVALGAQGISYFTFFALREGAPHLPALGALFLGAVIASAFSYTGQRCLTFRGAIRR